MSSLLPRPSLFAAYCAHRHDTRNSNFLEVCIKFEAVLSFSSFVSASRFTKPDWEPPNASAFRPTFRILLDPFKRVENCNSYLASGRAATTQGRLQEVAS